MKICLTFISCAVLILRPAALYALSSALTDPDLAVFDDASRFQGVFNFKMRRNFRLPMDAQNLWSANHINSLPSGAAALAGLRLSLPLASLLSSPNRLKKSSLFASLSYLRRLSLSRAEARIACYRAWVCIDDMDIGLAFPPLFQKGRFSLQSAALYLKLPTSRVSFKSGILTGAGASIGHQWEMMSNAYFKLLTVSSHFAEAFVFSKRSSDYLGRTYNKLLTAFNQAGLGLRPLRRLGSKAALFLPDFYVYGSHAAFLDARLNDRHQLSLSASASWRLGQNGRLSLGLLWGERAFVRPGVKAKIIKRRSFADHTQAFLGLSRQF